MTYDTLTYNGTEKKFADWGFELNLIHGSKRCGQADTFNVTIVTNNISSESASPTFPFEAFVIVRVNRSSSDGSANSFSGGTIKFQGKCAKPAIAAVMGNHHWIRYEFRGPWYDLENTDYQQLFKGSATNPYLLPETCFFTGFQTVSYSGQTYGWLPISVGDQIQQILQFVLDAYSQQGMTAPFQYVGRTLYSGAIDYTVDAGTTGTPGWDGSSANDYNFYGQKFTRSRLYPNASTLTIDKSLYNLFLPSLPAQKSSRCAEALNKCLQLSPRINIWFDYTTTPPTIHFSLVDSMTPKTLALFDGTAHKSLAITPRYDLIPRAVIIKYRFNNTISGNQVADYLVDKYSAGGHNANLDGTGNNSTDPNDGLRVVNDLVDLSGFSLAYQKGHMDLEPLAAIGGTQSTKRTWWASKRGGEVATLEDNRVRFQQFTADGAGKSPWDAGWTPTATATTIPDSKIYYAGAGFDGLGNDSAGTPLTPDSSGRYEFSTHDYSTFTYRIVRGSYQGWFKQGSTSILACKAKVVSQMTYAEYSKASSSGTPDTDVSDCPAYLVKYNSPIEHHVNVELTNAAPDSGTSGYANFQILASQTPSETAWIGIAKYIYQHLSALQYDGDFVKVQASFDNSDAGTYVTLGNSLNFSGGATAWSSMNAQIQSIHEDYGKHETTLRIGVNKILSAGQLSSLMNMWRFRRPWYNPALVTDNTVGGGGAQVDMAKTVGQANTTNGLEVLSHLKNSSPYTPPS
jgi:hypothetical protein